MICPEYAEIIQNGRGCRQPVIGTRSSTSAKKSAPSVSRHSGGLILSTHIRSPVGWMTTPAFEHAVADGHGLLGGRLRRHPVSCELHAQVEAGPAHRADQLVPSGQLFQPALQVSAHPRGVGLQPSSRIMSRTVSPATQETGLPPVVVEEEEEEEEEGWWWRRKKKKEEEKDKKKPTSRYRAAIAREVTTAPQRVAVAHRLGHRDHVRHHALPLEGPTTSGRDGRSRPGPRPRWRPRRTPDLGVDRGQVAVGWRHAAWRCRRTARPLTPGRAATGREVADDPYRVAGVPAGLRAAVGVRRVDRVHLTGTGGQRVRVVRGGGGDRARGAGPAVVILAHRHHVRWPVATRASRSARSTASDPELSPGTPCRPGTPTAAAGTSTAAASHDEPAASCPPDPGWRGTTAAACSP